MFKLGLGGFDSKAAGKARAEDLLLLLNNWINKLLEGLSSLDCKCQALMTSMVDKCLNDTYYLPLPLRSVPLSASMLSKQSASG